MTVKIDSEYSEEDFGEYHAKGYYETTYNHEHYDGTLESPPEDDFERTVEYLIETEINSLLKNKLSDSINIKNIIDAISISISEDSNDIEINEYEPDWD